MKWKPFLFLSLLFLTAGAFCEDTKPEDNRKTDPVRYSFHVSVRMRDMDFVQMPWVWNVEMKRYVTAVKDHETAIAILIRDPHNPRVYDVWVWRADRSSDSHYADDLNGWLLPDGTVKLECDAGTPAWQLTRPPAVCKGVAMKRYAPRTPIGSRGDVRVTSFFRHEVQSMYITFTRDENTGYPDDLPLHDKLEYALCAISGDTPIHFEDLQFFPMNLEKVEPPAPQQQKKADNDAKKPAKVNTEVKK